MRRIWLLSILWEVDGRYKPAIRYVKKFLYLSSWTVSITKAKFEGNEYFKTLQNLEQFFQK